MGGRALIANNPHLYRHNRRLATAVADKYHRALNAAFDKMGELNVKNPNAISAGQPTTVCQICVPMDTKANSLLDLSQYENDPSEWGGSLTFTADVGFSGFAGGAAGPIIGSGLSFSSYSAMTEKTHFMGAYLTAIGGSGLFEYCMGVFDYPSHTSTPISSSYINVLAGTAPASWSMFFQSENSKNSPYYDPPSPNVWFGLQHLNESNSCTWATNGGYGSWTSTTYDAAQSTLEIGVGSTFVDSGSGKIPASLAISSTVGAWAIGVCIDASNVTPTAQKFNDFGGIFDAYMNHI